jgi:Ca-activated chloride channel homolog
VLETFTPVAPAWFSSAAIILLTDGRATFGIHHAKAAQMAAERGVRVYTVGFGDPNPTTIDLDGEAYDVSFDEDALKDMAEITRAAYFHASTAEELNAVYHTLKGQVVLDRKQRELTVVFTALGAVLSLTSAGLSFAWGSPLM